MTESFYTPPQSNLKPSLAVDRKEFYVVSLRKFVILYLATLGWYGLYWFYRQWTENRRFSGSSVLPVLRAMFAFIFVFPLFRKVDQSLRRQELGSMALWWVSAGILFVLSVVGVVLSMAGEHARVEDSPVWFGLLLPLITAQIINVLIVQRKMNVAAQDPSGQSNSSLSGANWAWVAFGSLFWLSNLATFLLFGI
ncbi:hypothetical protein EGJ27_10265 [Pseudomonas sp. v388]|uniref:hypothetical protein n=1 Tax=Pseudomonas sp. v388 TaxID=2479849 RepID=UPI000F7AD71B|nr:hypothetical protein [Pseudomonas sp. v388]RRV08422.1 hypothetical protein EGJ27_10265 [Pseudomonas sp. v388]